jgi:3-hydroxyacyl-[acyl-carrier-protein] dehydratase
MHSGPHSVLGAKALEPDAIRRDSEIVIENLNASQIMRYQRNRYPLLFIDRVIRASPGDSAQASKSFTYNEWFFPAHYEDEPVVPGFVTLEAMAQTFLMTFLTLPKLDGEKTGLARYDRVSFRKKLVPGDTLIFDASLDSFSRGIARGSVLATLSGEAAASCELTVTVPSVMSQFRPSVK